VTSRRTSIPGVMRTAGLVFTLASLAFAGILVARHGGDLAAQWTELRAAGWRPRPGWLLAALAAATGNLFLLGGAWVLLVRALGGEIGYLEGMRAWTWTNLGRYLPGRVWQISALTLYLREKKRIGGIGLGSSLLLQVQMLAVGAAIAFAVFGLRLAEGRLALIAGASGFTLAGLVAALRPSIVGGLTRRVSGWMGEPWQGADPAPQALWTSAAVVTVSWFLYGFGLWLLWRGLGADGGPDTWFWTGAFAAAYLVGYVALFAPAGLIVREASLTGFLVGFGGVAAAPAAGVAIASRLWAIASELCAAALSWVIPGAQGAQASSGVETDDTDMNETETQ